MSMICQECKMTVPDEPHFHPYLHCILWKALHLDPEKTLASYGYSRDNPIDPSSECICGTIMLNGEATDSLNLNPDCVVHAEQFKQVAAKHDTRLKELLAIKAAKYAEASDG